MDTSSISESPSVAPSIIRTSQDLRLPRWVNEPLPDLRAILTANEISRLTRRPRWLLLGLAAIGRFPKQRTHCGKPVGWHRADVLDWLTQNIAIEPDRPRTTRRRNHTRPSQICLPLDVRPSHDSLNDCRRCHSTGRDHL
jgi:predicted DNA-binding transcriptional regulator AlpA